MYGCMYVCMYAIMCVYTSMYVCFFSGNVYYYSNELKYKDQQATNYQKATTLISYA